jgi:hypothetical protein
MWKWLAALVAVVLAIVGFAAVLIYAVDWGDSSTASLGPIFVALYAVLAILVAVCLFVLAAICVKAIRAGRAVAHDPRRI